MVEVCGFGKPMFVKVCVCGGGVVLKFLKYRGGQKFGTKFVGQFFNQNESIPYLLTVY